MTFRSIFKMLQSFESKSSHAFKQTNIFVQLLNSQQNCKPFVLFRTRTNLFPKTLRLPIIHFYPRFRVLIKLELLELEAVVKWVPRTVTKLRAIL